jgi:nucleoside-diphosphate-sugar epimerase
MGVALAGTARPIIITSGTGLLAQGQLAMEENMPAPGPNPRIASEEAADVLAASGIRVSVVRLPPSVHGEGDHGFVPMLINIARQKGIAAYKGEGLNRWPAVHRLDAARLFRLALEKSSAGGTRFHGVAEEGVAFRDITEVIGKKLKVPVASISAEEAAVHFGWFAHFAALDNPSSSRQTRESLGWEPVQAGLLADMDCASYFSA